MTPKTEGETVTRPGRPFHYEGKRYNSDLFGWGADLTVGAVPYKSRQRIRMTLCGSEVPQDRWRGRTAGSGMWTLTKL